jgi:hypothetical protein
MSARPAPERDPNTLSPDEYSMLDGAEVTADVANAFVRVTVRRKLELKGTTLVLHNSLIKQLAAHVTLQECAAAQVQQNGGAIVPATGLPPAPSSGKRS